MIKVCRYSLQTFSVSMGGLRLPGIQPPGLLIINDKYDDLITSGDLFYEILYLPL
jgi:hypothetical protein